MEDSTLFTLWNNYEKKFTENELITQKNLQDITSLKVANFLSSMKPAKIFTIFCGILWVGVVGLIIVNLISSYNGSVSVFFICSALIQVVLTAIAIIVYTYQLILIYNVDISEPVLKTQETLTRLKTSTLWVTKILFLQFPVWTTFYLSKNMLTNAPTFALIIQGIVTICFTCFAVWLFLNIKYENRHKKWFKLIFTGREWTPLVQSMELLEEITQYKTVA